jgi:hypothetical protein
MSDNFPSGMIFRPDDDPRLDTLQSQSRPHTPGPWRVVEPVAIDYRAPLIYGADGGSLVATVEGGGRKRAVDAAEARSNAHLIAAAPDLLTACKLARDLLKPELVKEPDRSIFWKLVKVINEASGTASSRG